MNQFKTPTLLLFFALLLCFTACDESTDTIGTGLAGNMDNFIIKADTFLVTSETKQTGAVMARSSYANLGCIRDYDTGALIRSSYTTQFYLLPGRFLPDKDSIRSTYPDIKELKDTTNIPIENIVADSAYAYVLPSNIIGDSLQPMHIKVYELTKPIADGKTYLSDFDPIKEGYVDVSKPLKSMTFTMADQTVDSVAKASSNYMTYFKIPLNDPYTRNGKTYSNIGTYLMQRYYESLRDKDGTFNDYNKFTYNVLHGLYITVDNGEGAMASVLGTELKFSFRYWESDTTARQNGFVTIYGTNEVLQTTNMEVNKDAIEALAADNSCTYLKTPAGLYTEMTLPVTEILQNHEKDSISNVKLTLQCMRNEGLYEKSYSPPSHLLMIPADDIQSFFKDKKLEDGRSAFIATYNSTLNTYTFSNFAGMIRTLYYRKANSPSNDTWNKVALIPVSVVYSSTSSTGTTSAISAIYHDMSLSSAKLVGGANPLLQTKISVTYTRMSD
ncbi:MAG: DUF4270 domain-containing protein [Bacteroidaceae bacterium]|nr:DUF4270 domain-containing protein [Bacteroidaceae bacterium]